MINSKSTKSTTQEQTQDYEFPFAKHHRVVEGVDRKSNFYQIWVQTFQLSTTHVSSTFRQNRLAQPDI